MYIGREMLEIGGKMCSGDQLLSENIQTNLKNILWSFIFFKKKLVHP